MRTIYVIKDTGSDSWVTSSKHVYLGKFDEAAIFNQSKNAEKAIREMNAHLARSASWMMHGQYVYVTKALQDGQLNDPRITADQRAEFYASTLVLPLPVFKVVPCTVAPVREQFSASSRPQFGPQT